MSLPDDLRIISSDDHMDIHVLPPDLFASRLPANYREQGPRVVETDDGPFWQVEGKLLSPSGRKAKGYIASEDHGFRPGQPETRLADMDRDGVYAQVVYSPMTTQLNIAEPGLRRACMAAYNDWAVEFNRAVPERIVLLPHIPGDDPAAAHAELERCARLGHRGAIISQDEGTDPLFEDSWLPFWDVANDAGLPISVHLGPKPRHLAPQLGSWRMPAFVSIIPMQLDETLVGLTFSGILEQRPNVKLVLGEGGLGWVPYVIERMDHEHHKYYDKTHDHRLSMLPSEIFARQIYCTYEDEGFGVRMIPEIGVDNVMWASDYPHGDSTWPHSRKVLGESHLSGLGEAVLHKVLHDTASKLYRL